MALPAFIAPLISNVVEGFTKLIPDKNERERAKEQMEAQLLGVVAAGMQGQLEINKQEAAHKSVFVAGWRPFIGWTCGIGIAWQFVFTPVANWVIRIMLATHPDMPDIPDLPLLDVGELIGLVMAMLGMGGLRTFEKLKGVSRDK